MVAKLQRATVTKSIPIFKFLSMITKHVITGLNGGQLTTETGSNMLKHVQYIDTDPITIKLIPALVIHHQSAPL